MTENLNPLPHAKGQREVALPLFLLVASCAFRMSWPIRFLFLLPILGVIPLTLRGAQTVPGTSAISPWHQFVSTEVFTGYRDNLLFSDRNREASWLYGASVEGTLMRLPRDGHQFTGFLFAEHLRYPEGATVDSESLAFVRLDYHRLKNEKWRFGSRADYIFQDQVFDASTTEPFPVPIQARGHKLLVAPDLRWQFHDQYRFEWEIHGERQFFIFPLDDYWEAGPAMAIIREYGSRNELGMRYELHRRYYDSRNEFTAEGARVDGTDLTYTIHEAGLDWRHYWDERRQWRTTGEWTSLRSEDSGSGYFDYWRHQLTLAARIKKEKWEADIRVRAAYYHYDLQRTEFTSGDLRQKWLFSTRLKIGYNLSDDWNAFAEYERNQSLSNRDIDEYTVNTVRAGLRWNIL